MMRRKKERAMEMKKMTSVFLSLALCLALTVPAFAAPAKAAAKAPAKKAAVGVLLNGKEVSFTDASPVVKNGRTMVPFRALMETLGGDVSYGEDGTVTCKVGDTTLSFKLDEKNVTITTGTETKTIQMDVPATYSNGRTYVPVRFFAQALGYDVFWDDDDDDAVLIDRQTLINSLDKNFTVLNAALKKVQGDSTANYKASAAYQIDLNLKDDDKAVTGSIKMQLSLISSAKGVEIHGTADASALAAAMDLESSVKNKTLSAAQAALIRSSLSALSFDMIVNLEQDTMYIKLPAVFGLLTGTAAPAANTWYKIPLNIKGLLSDAGTLQPTVGSMLYAMNYSMAQQGGEDAGDFYEDTVKTGGILASLLGDASAVTSGSASTWKMDLAKLAALDKDTAETFKTFDVTLTADNGTLTCTFNIVTVPDDGESMGFNGSMSLNSTGETVSMKASLGSMGTMGLQLLMTMEKTTETPAAQPPAGAVIADGSGLATAGSLASNLAA